MGFSATLSLLMRAREQLQMLQRQSAVQVEQICKSLVFRTESQKSVLLLVSGANRVKEKSIERYIGEKIEKGDANFVYEKTGFAIGGIPPLGHKTAFDYVLIDETLAKLDSVWAAAGTPHSVFQIATNDLVRISGGQVASMG